MPRNKRLHFKDLHALRALAFFPIFFFCILSLINTTRSGLLFDTLFILEKLARNSFDFFFFLSAFLLTSHGLREYKYLEKFSYKNFLIRRAMRIGPVLIIALLFTFLIHPWLINVLDLHPIQTPNPESYFLLIPNYLTSFSGDELLYLQLVGTIYMFIQFYIFWGLILLFLRRYITIIAILLILTGFIVRTFYFMHELPYLNNTLAFGIPIGIGALTALLVRNEGTWFERIKNFPKQTVIFIYLMGTILLLCGYYFTVNSFMSTTIPLFTGLFFAYIVIEQTFGRNSFVQLKSLKILSYLGKISYGMIIYQAIIGVLLMIGVESLDIEITSYYTILLVITAGFIGSIILADLSYKLLEKPMIRIRREFKKV